MSSKFKVIESTNEDKLQEMDRISKIAGINEIWERYFFDMVMRYTKEYGTLYKLPQDKLAKVGLAGIKYICSCRDVCTELNDVLVRYKDLKEDCIIERWYKYYRTEFGRYYSGY